MGGSLFDLATGLVLVLAFLACAAAAAAVARALPEAVRQRHPDLVGRIWAGGARRGSPAVLRAWRLALEVVARELAGGRPAATEDRASAPGGWLATLERDLARAGSPAGETPARLLARAALEGVGVSLGLALASQLTLGRPLLVTALGAGGFHAVVVRPQLLRSRARARLGSLVRRLPYAMDLMVLVVEAGGTLDEALDTVAASAAQGDPLAEEIGGALAQVEAGSTRRRALRGVAGRLDQEDLTSLVVALDRADATGAPVAETLESQAEVVQRRRLQRAETLAVEAPVKMMFPNMLILIAVLLIVLGPICVELAAEGFL